MESLDTLIEQRERTPERDQSIRDGLRQWGADTFGTVDAFCGEVARRKGWTASHVRNSLTAPRSEAVLDEAIALYREHETTEAAHAS